MKKGIFFVFVILFSFTFLYELLSFSIYDVTSSNPSNYKVTYSTYLEKDLPDSFLNITQKIFTNKTSNPHDAEIIIISTKPSLSPDIILWSLENGKVIVMVGNESEYYFGKIITKNYTFRPPFRFGYTINSTEKDSSITMAYLENDHIVTRTVGGCNGEVIQYCINKLVERLGEYFQSKNEK